MAHAGPDPSGEEADKQEHASSTKKLLPATSAHSHTGNQSSGAVRASPVTGFETDCFQETVIVRRCTDGGCLLRSCRRTP